MPTLNPLPDLLIEPVVRAALLDDLGRAGDITTNRIVPADLTASGIFAVRKPGRIAGLAAARLAFHLMDPAMEFKPLVEDGDTVAAGQQIATVGGNARAMLTAERSALNLLCHLSGIATETARLAALIPRNVPARLVGTRKTTPGLRALEKYAVNCGGGLSHRYGLDDAVLIKDNHVALAGSVREAIRRVRQDLGHMVKVEVEVDTLEQLNEVLDAGRIDCILLDNMPPEMLRKAVVAVRERPGPVAPPIIEASGGITAETIAAVASSGVDLISSGWITHSAPILDIGLDL